MAWLTKSRFMAGRQCLKRLWFEVNQPLTEPMATSMPLWNGQQFDLLVQGFEPGTVISREAGMPSAIAETRRVMQAGSVSVLYQPAFRVGDLAVIADILRVHRDGSQLVEVKASTKVKPEHLPDVAFQTLVLRAAKVPVTSVAIGHVDNRFVLERPGDYAGLKVETDVTAQVESLLIVIEGQAASLVEVMVAPEVPDIVTGPHCLAPYECPFLARCLAAEGAEVEYPVEILPRGARKAAELRAEGYEDLRRVPAELLESEDHLRVHAATVSGEAILDPAAKAVLAEFGFPKAYLDFETMGFAVPEVVGTGPYQQWPFQFSLHIEEATGEVRHVEFLNVEAFGEFERLAAALVDAVPDSGPVFVYSASMEAGVIARLAERLPVYRARLEAIGERLVDLLPITRAHYYHPHMKGSWSIKTVLPTIDPALAYEGLEGVSEGEAAQLAFLEIRDPETSAERRERLKRELKVYCGRDTWAMVVLRRFLSGEKGGAGAAWAHRLRTFAQESMAGQGLDLVLRGPYRWGDPDTPPVTAYLGDTVLASKDHLVFFVGVDRIPLALKSSTLILIDERGPTVIDVTSAGDEG